MDVLEGVVKNYPWGSHSALAELRGEQPTAEPEAELWLGAHLGGPAMLQHGNRRVDLARRVADDPVEILGHEVIEQFGPRLPYLVKILTASVPLSLQAHPNLEEAAIGYDRENKLGIPLGDARRSFRDRNHKPELICALSPFVALSGFRELEESHDFLAGLSVPGLDRLIEPLSDLSQDGVIAAVGAFLAAEESATRELSVAVAAACAASNGPDAFADERAEIVNIAEFWPGDPGVVVALLLNLVHLAPGEALFMDAGRLHCYLRGSGIEVMASSDNVIRGGLTTKHIDVRHLMALLRPQAAAPDIQRPSSPHHSFDTPVPDFALDRIELDGETSWDIAGPEILLPLGGPIEIASSTSTVVVEPAVGALLVPGDRRVRIRGTATVFRTSVPPDSAAEVRRSA